jgi:pimeloyl-ACP methyl ester carboxylesterase
MAVALAVVAGVALLACGGCGSTIGAEFVKPQKGYERLADDGAAGDVLSSDSRIVLRWFGLEPLYADAPEEAIRRLFEISRTDTRRELLFTLAEMNYRLAAARPEASENHHPGAERFLTASICAYFYLFSTEGEPPSVYDWRFRRACDLHNFGLARAMLDEEGARLLLTEESRRLPCFGDRRVTLAGLSADAAEGGRRFIPADQLRVRGLSVKVRRTGIGAPLVEVGKARRTQPMRESRAVTLTMGPPGSWKEFIESGAPVPMALHGATDTRRVEIAGQNVPVQMDLTTPLAYTLNDPLYWDLGVTEFLTGNAVIPNGLYPLQPYAPGLVPVIFVHGTMSSPAYWGEMLNTLRADPLLRRKCQFWVFIYDSGKALQFSARELQNAIRERLKEAEAPRDAALGRMVIIGHSQGGLLAKLAATNTGDRLLRAATDKGLDELNVPPDVREVICNMAVFEAVPEVRRVVFIATPHRGSYLASSLARRLARGLVTLPAHVLRTTEEAVKGVATFSVPTRWQAYRYSTSIDSMSPGNPALLALAELPVAEGVTAHSIIALKDPAKAPAGGDGVVAYESAHVPYVASEYLVAHNHSCQGDPLVVEEVRRILHEHLKAEPPPTAGERRGE